MSTAAFRPLTPALGSSTVIAPLLPPDTTRLASLDIFRGATIALMMLVNNPGSGAHKYDPLEHAVWNGWTATDMVFPFFLFIMGVAIPFSMAKRAATESKGDLFLHILTRGLALFLLGELGYAIPGERPPHTNSVTLIAARIAASVFLAAAFLALLYPWKSRRRSLLVPSIVGIAFLVILFALHFLNHHALAAGWVKGEAGLGKGIFNPDNLRIPGVLQRIGVCYVVVASIALVASWHVITIAILALLAGYSWLMLCVSYPSITNPGQMVHGLLGEQDNLARYLDTHVFGRHVYGEYPDPEGIVSTIPAIATACFGVLAGVWLRTERPAVDRFAGLLALGVLVTFIAEVLNATLMPINKRLWTPSYAVFFAGLGMLGLGAVFYVADVLRYRRWALPFTVYGMNAITAFVLSGILGRLILLIHMDDPKTGNDVTVRAFLANRAGLLTQHLAIGNPANNASLAYAVGYVLFFLILMSIFYKLKIFLKV